MTASRLRGVIAATATPVHADFSPDIERLLPHLRHLLEDGCDAINLLGTTGEANSFALAQRLRVMVAVKEGGLPMDRFMVGTGVCSLDETVQLTQAAADLGFAGALVLPPFFYPDIAPAALLAYVDALVARLRPGALALYLYHIPQNTGVPWPVEVVAALAEKHAGLVCGIKDSAGDLAYSRAVVAAAPGFAVFPSSEATLWQATRDGFAGCISATTNLTAGDSQQAWSNQGSEAGKVAVERATACRTHLARHALVANVKAALGVLYGDAQWARTCLPLLPRSAAQSDTLAGDLRNAGLKL
ncbi:MAG: dihydrodipicolinate synthase family protein [Pseudomonadota bacterium]|nr:dihydrodipicolinate synthase family protein [Pseudomonadota bacterium]